MNPLSSHSTQDFLPKYGYLQSQSNIHAYSGFVMGATIENFKGISFVRISSMPKDQQEKVWNSFEKEKIIKIIKDQALMNDCILYSDFAAWQSNQLATQQQTKARPVRDARSAIGKLAFE